MSDHGEDGFLKDAAGKRVEFVLTVPTGNKFRELTAEAIREDLGKVGVKVELQRVDFETLQGKLHANHGYECAIFLLSGGQTLPYSTTLKSSGPMHVWRSYRPVDWQGRLDSLMVLQSTTLDPAIQKKQWDEAQAIMAEQLPLIYTVTRRGYAAGRSDLRNLRPSNSTDRHLTWNLEELYLGRQ